MHRFFIDSENIKENCIEINNEDVKHIKNVLRLEEGDIISICDKKESDYICKITQINKQNIVCDILEAYKSKGEAPIDIVLYQGLPKSDKMELIIQKATELGVKKIVPVATKRTVVKIQDKKREEKKIERWVRIAEEAAKQSKRGLIPEIGNIIEFKELLNIFKDEEFIVVPYESEKNIGIKEVLKNCKSKKINILIGPEGGFEEFEIEGLKDINSHIVTLGPRILRTETAGLTATSIVLYELGDLGVV